MQLFTGIEYLKIDIANNFGHDKLDWLDRIRWTTDHEDCLEDLLAKAEEPALYFAAVQAYRAVQKGEPIGYPISLDATSSGLQLLAVLTGDRSAAQLCNVVDTGHREDAYQRVFDVIVDILTERLGPDVAGQISRKDLKRAIMTALYGSTAVPKEVFGEGVQLETFYEVMNELAPAAWELNEAFMKIWDSEALSNDWVLPDNFHVHVKVMVPTNETVNFLNEPFEITRQVNAATSEGRSLGANTVHSVDGFIVREMARRCDYDLEHCDEVARACSPDAFIIGGGQPPVTADDKMVVTLWELYQKSGFLSARILDHLWPHNIHLVDKGVITELLTSLPVKPFKVISVHDCFRCLPTYGNDLRRQYNRCLYLIAKSQLLSFLLSQLIKRGGEDRSDGPKPS